MNRLPLDAGGVLVAVLQLAEGSSSTRARAFDMGGGVERSGKGGVKLFEVKVFFY